MFIFLDQMRRLLEAKTCDDFRSRFIFQTDNFLLDSVECCVNQENTIA